ncbi:MAG: VCBS repeat-containing protein [Bacteroidetes bacterium]|nr:VCBS repeat-containing protein [Bacteroidota bacterium]
MRNSLQLNNRNGTFSEIAQLSGVATTDWSWAVLMADFDNDGLKDMFTTNGYRRDSRDKDFNHELEMKVTGDGANIDFEDYISSMPTTRLHNFLFRNEGNMIFSDQSYAFGIDQPGYSNGATYADLDNDGDLDLVVNNLVDKAFIYRNNSNENEGSNYLRIKFNGSKNNPQGIGTKVEISIGENHQYQELTLTRGYQSGVEPILHFGVGASNVIERVLVTWPDGKEEELIDVKANQVLELKYSDASIVGVSLEKNDPIFIELPRSVTDFIHVENEFDDYFGESLLPHKMSQFGPNISIGDIDKDGNEDFYIGGAALQSGALFRTNSEGAFIRLTNQPWENEIDYEDLGSVFFDADNDGDEDLYIVSGGNEYAPGSIYLQDRLYLNDGDGQFTKAVDRLPNITSSGSCVIAGDYDKDGDMDLFVGGRVLPGKYPFAPRSYILQNNNGVFKDVTKDIAPGLFEPGMVTSAVWTDIDKDNDLDLIIVGEWMPVSIYENEDGTFTDATSKYGLSHTVGWWNKIIAADFDHDGDMEYVLGNLGLNSKFKASQTEPLHVYCSDFDNSGTLDIVLGYYNQGVCFPVRGRQCTSEQMPVIRDQFPTYDQFAKASLVEVYGSRLDEAEHHEAKVFTTSYLENNNGTLTLTALPIEAQFSPVFGIVAEDFDHDGNRDILLSGNFYAPEVETGRYDASIGLLLTGSGTGKFIPVNVNESGFFTPGDVKDMTLLHNGFGGEVFILVANNNDRLQVFKTRLSIPVFGD